MDKKNPLTEIRSAAACVKNMGDGISVTHPVTVVDDRRRFESNLGAQSVEGMPADPASKTALDRAAPSASGLPSEWPCAAVSDECLVARIATRDQASFARFYDRLAPRTLGLLVKMLRDRSAAEAALQEVFWEVWRRAAEFDRSRTSAVAWLALIARSRAIRHLRVRRPSLPGESVAAPDDNPRGLPDRGASTVAAREALARLPAEQRDLLALAFFGGLTHEAISLKQSLPLGTVKSRIRMGMQRLRELLVRERKAEAQ